MLSIPPAVIQKCVLFLHDHTTVFAALKFQILFLERTIIYRMVILVKILYDVLKKLNNIIYCHG